MRKPDQSVYKQNLLELRKRLIAEIESTEEAIRQDIHSPDEQSSVPTHPADHVAEGLHEKLAIAQNEECLLEQVEAALQRIEAGTFGTCENCGRAIPAKRLTAVPYSPWCVACARQHEQEATAGE